MIVYTAEKAHTYIIGLDIWPTRYSPCDKILDISQETTVNSAQLPWLSKSTLREPIDMHEPLAAVKKFANFNLPRKKPYGRASRAGSQFLALKKENEKKEGVGGESLSAFLGCQTASEPWKKSKPGHTLAILPVICGLKNSLLVRELQPLIGCI